jgi:hypothetical protein
MEPSIRRAALRAAQKTAIVLALAGASLGSGCAASHERGLDVAPVVDAAPPEPDAATVWPETDAAVAPDADAAPPIPDDCDERLASLELSGTEDTWTTRFASDEARADPATGACCMELERAAEAGTPDVAFTPLAMACCDVIVAVQHLQPFSNLGCTPWGPPCPPEAPV